MTKDFLTVTPDSGSKSGTLNVVASENKSDKRTSAIVIKSGSYANTINVTQQAGIPKQITLVQDNMLSDNWIYAGDGSGVVTEGYPQLQYTYKTKRFDDSVFNWSLEAYNIEHNGSSIDFYGYQNLPYGSLAMNFNWELTDKYWDSTGGLLFEIGYVDITFVIKPYSSSGSWEINSAAYLNKTNPSLPEKSLAVPIFTWYTNTESDAFSIVYLFQESDSKDAPYGIGLLWWENTEEYTEWIQNLGEYNNKLLLGDGVLAKNYFCPVSGDEDVYVVINQSQNMSDSQLTVNIEQMGSNAYSCTLENGAFSGFASLNFGMFWNYVDQLEPKTPAIPIKVPCFTWYYNNWSIADINVTIANTQ